MTDDVEAMKREKQRLKDQDKTEAKIREGQLEARAVQKRIREEARKKEEKEKKRKEQRSKKEKRLTNHFN